MFKTRLFSFAAAALTFSLNVAEARTALGPILVGQGGGESEFSIVFVRQNLAEILSTCLAVDCGLPVGEKATLRQLAQQARGARLQVAFQTSAEMGQDVFQILDQGRTVAINQDRLWLDPEFSRPYDIPAATGLWIDILSQTNPALDASSVGRLSPIVTSQAARGIARSQIRFQTESIFEALVFKKSEKEHRLYLRDSAYNTFDATPAIRASELCFAAQATELQFNTVRWAWLNPQGDAGLRMGLEVILNWKCPDGSHRGRAKLVILAKQAAKIFAIDPGTAEVFLEGE